MQSRHTKRTWLLITVCLFSASKNIYSAQQSDYYKILRVDQNATVKQIKKAFRKLALKWHPDRNFGNKEAAEAKFKEMGKAYEILSDPAKRVTYNRLRFKKKYVQEENLETESEWKDFFAKDLNDMFKAADAEWSKPGPFDDILNEFSSQFAQAKDTKKKDENYHYKDENGDVLYQSTNKYDVNDFKKFYEKIKDLKEWSYANGTFTYTETKDDGKKYCYKSNDYQQMEDFQYKMAYLGDDWSYLGEEQNVTFTYTKKGDNGKISSYTTKDYGTARQFKISLLGDDWSYVGEEKSVTFTYTKKGDNGRNSSYTTKDYDIAHKFKGQVYLLGDDWSYLGEDQSVTFRYHRDREIIYKTPNFEEAWKFSKKKRTTDSIHEYVAEEMPKYREMLKAYLDNGGEEEDFVQFKPRVVIDENTGIPKAYESFEHEMDVFLKDFKSKKSKQEYSLPNDRGIPMRMIGIPLLLALAYFIIRQKKKMKKQKKAWLQKAQITNLR